MKYSGFQLPTTMKPENEVSESFCDEIFESSGVTVHSFMVSYEMDRQV